MADLSNELLAKAQQLKPVTYPSSPPPPPPPASPIISPALNSPSLNDALLKSGKLAERQKAVEIAQQREELEEKLRIEQEKREAEQREIEHKRRIADKTCCIGCGKTVNPTTEPHIGALERYWHRSCWKCSMCTKELIYPGEFYHSDFKLLCYDDYARKFICTVCLKPIVGDSLNFWGKPYHKTCYNDRGCAACTGAIDSTKEFLIACDTPFHKECFKCSKCNALIFDDFILVGNSAWCKPCNAKSEGVNFLHKKKDTSRTLHQVRIIKPDNSVLICAKCNKEIKSGMEALGSHWHNECFCCGICGKVVFDIGYFETEDGKQALCEDCFNSQNLASCPTCQKPIVTDYVTILGKEYHPACALCSLCKSPLGNEVFQSDGNPICGLCVRRQRVKAGFKA